MPPDRELVPDQAEPQRVCADCGATDDLYFHEVDGEWVCEETPDCRERQFDDAMAERDRLRAENEVLRAAFCDEAYILMVQALDVKALGKGRRRILTDQALRMARVGLREGTPRHTQFISERIQDRARDVIASLASDDQQATT